MELNKNLFEKLANDAAKLPRMRINFDLRDSSEEQCQRMLNILLPGTFVAPHKHEDTSEVVVCIYGTVIERLYDNEGREVQKIEMQAGGKVPGVWIEKGMLHSLEAKDSMSVVFSCKAGMYDVNKSIFLKV